MKSNIFQSSAGSTILYRVSAKNKSWGWIRTYQAKGYEKALQWLKKATKKILLQADDLASKFKRSRFFKNIHFLNKKTNFFYFYIHLFAKGWLIDR